MKPNRVMRLLAILGALALILAACGNGDTTDTTEAPETPDATEAPETTDAPETTEAPATEPPEEGPLGAVTVADGEDIQIRSLQAITGDVAFLGIPNARGVDMAILDYGAIKGHDVSVGTGLDDLCSADGGQAAAQTIVSDEQVIGVVGTSCSGAAVAAMPLISAAGMVMISSSNTSPALTSDMQGNVGTDNHAGYYRTAHNDFIQGAVAAQFASEELGLTAVALIHDGDPYTNGLTSAFEGAFTSTYGGTITVHTAVAKEQVDMVPVLTEVAASGPEAIYFPIFPAEGTFIVQQVGGIAGLEDVILYGADGLIADNFLEIPESEGMYFSGPNLAFGANTNAITGKSADDVKATYEATYGEPPSAPFWAHSYDAAILLLSAIDEVAVALDDGSLFIDRQALRDALGATSGWAGITGVVNCDEFGDCAAGEVTVIFHEDSTDIEATKNNIVFSNTE